MNDLYTAISGMGNAVFNRLQETINMVNETAMANKLSFPEAASKIYELIKPEYPEEEYPEEEYPEEEYPEEEDPEEEDSAVKTNTDEGDHRDRVDSDDDVWKYLDVVGYNCSGHWTMLGGNGARTLKEIDKDYGPIRAINRYPHD